jgi:hypothetical protein
MRLPAIALAACWFAAGCAGDREGAGAADAPAAGLVEELRIDGVQHNLVPIGYLGGVAVRGDGTIALRQGQDSRVLFFAADGQTAGSFGGPGEGPGEFRGMGRMGWMADSLWVLDAGTARITLIAPDFTLARIMPVPMQARPPAADAGRIPVFPFAIPLAPHADGTFLASLDPGLLPGVPEAFRHVIVHATITADGTVGHIHARSRMPDGSSVMSASGGVASVPFVHRPLYAVGPDGSRSALAESVVEQEQAGSIRVTAFTKGDTLFTRVYPFEAVAIPQSVRDSTMTAREQDLRARNPELADAFRDQARPPTTYPPVSSLVVGNDGSIWIERPDAGGSRIYFAIAADGEPLGTVDLPRSSRLAAAERGRIWVLERDESDVESVVRYRADW